MVPPGWGQSARMGLVCLDGSAPMGLPGRVRPARVICDV